MVDRSILDAIEALPGKSPTPREAIRNEQTYGIRPPVVTPPSQPEEPVDPLALSRSGASMVGGIAGAELGLAASQGMPNPVVRAAIPVAAGALGTVAGALSPELAVKAGQMAGIVSDDVKGLSPGEALNTAKNEGLTDLAIGSIFGGAPVYRQAGRAAVRAVMGVGREGAAAVRRAASLGIELAPIHVAGPRGEIYTRVVGGFPFVSTPMRQRVAESGRQALEAGDLMISRIGNAIDWADRGTQAYRQGLTVYRDFIDDTNARYATIRAMSDNVGNTIDPREGRQNARELIINWNQEHSRQRLVQGTAGEFTEAYEDPIRPILNDVITMSPRQTLGQIDNGLMTRIDEEIGRLTAMKGMETHVRRLTSLKAALIRDIRTNGTNPLIGQQLKEVDDYFNRGMETFESAVAQKVARVDRGKTFKVGLNPAGTLHSDELWSLAFSRKSPQAMDELHALLTGGEIREVAPGVRRSTPVDRTGTLANNADVSNGQTVFNDLVASHLRDSFNKAELRGRDSGELFDVNSFADSLGLRNPQSAEFGAIRRAMELAGGSIQDLRNLTESMALATGTYLPEVSSFIARRGTIGGARSAIRAALPGMDTRSADSMMDVIKKAGGAVLATVGVRKLSRIVSDPRKLRTFNQAFGDDVAVGTRNANLYRLIEFMLEDQAANWSDAEKTVFQDAKHALKGEFNKLEPIPIEPPVR